MAKFEVTTAMAIAEWDRDHPDWGWAINHPDGGLRYARWLFFIPKISDEPYDPDAMPAKGAEPGDFLGFVEVVAMTGWPDKPAAFMYPPFSIDWSGMAFTSRSGSGKCLAFWLGDPMFRMVPESRQPYLPMRSTWLEIAERERPGHDIDTLSREWSRVYMQDHVRASRGGVVVPF